MSRCRSCGAQIDWVPTTSSGKLMPLDIGVHPDGGVTLNVGLLGDVSAMATPGAGNRRTHFASCPNAAAHRSAS